MQNAVISGYPIVLPEHRAAFHKEHPDWHKAWLDSIKQTLKPDDVVIDVGVEQGDLSALVASWIPDGGMFLVEPVAGFWPTIRQTFEANGLGTPSGSFVGFAGNETVYPATSDANQWPSQSFDDPNEDPGFQHLNERFDLPRIRLDDWAILDIPAAFIVDIEGAELLALRGAETCLTEAQPTVWCAIHPDFMRDRYGHDPAELLAFMWRLGYGWEFLAFHSELHFKFTPR